MINPFGSKKTEPAPPVVVGNPWGNNCEALLREAINQLCNINLNTALLGQIEQGIHALNELAKQNLIVQKQILEVLSKLPVRPEKLSISWDKPQSKE